jgi:hypothetical protein
MGSHGEYINSPDTNKFLIVYVPLKISGGILYIYRYENSKKDVYFGVEKKIILHGC